MPTAVITGGSRGLGEALSRELAGERWNLVLDARGREDLEAVVTELSPRAVGVTGDVSDEQHRRDLAAAVARFGRVELLVNNASTLGQTPLPPLDEADLGALEQTFAVNVVAALGVYQTVAPYLAEDAVVVNVTSDAAVEAYEGWGLYGASKAALDQLSAVLAAERPDLRVYAFDPGDMRTRMHQDAFPGEDISDRPAPVEVIPSLLHLISARPPSGRYVGSRLPVVA